MLSFGKAVTLLHTQKKLEDATYGKGDFELDLGGRRR